MKLGFVSAILDTYSFEEMMDFASEKGFECVEVACWPQGKAERRYAGVSHIDVEKVLANDEYANHILKYAKEKGVQISSLAYYPNTMDGDLKKRTVAISHLKNLIKASAKLGINMVTTFIGRDQSKTVEANLELALGWATYNGDHMSMYGVNASVPKTLVRHLVRYYADTCNEEALSDILLDILDTPVSPELLPPEDGVISQKTEDLVGPYELHDFFLYHMLRFQCSPKKIYRIAKKAFEGKYEEEVILKWLKKFYWRFFSQQFKRSCLPDGPKVGSVAVSPRGDLRMPSDACVRIWIEELETL